MAGSCGTTRDRPGGHHGGCRTLRRTEGMRGDNATGSWGAAVAHESSVAIVGLSEPGAVREGEGDDRSLQVWNSLCHSWSRCWR